MTWSDLRRAPKPGSEETSDLLDWAVSAIDRLDRSLSIHIHPRKRIVGEIAGYWHEDRNGNHFTFARCNQTDTDVFIHENDFVKGLDYDSFQEGDEVSFELWEREGRYSGSKVAGSRDEERIRRSADNDIEDLVWSIHKSLYVPFIQIWRDGRSTTDSKCPREFADLAKRKITYLADLLNQAKVPQPVKDEILFLLACLHKDTTDECVQWITEQSENGNLRNPRAVGLALGDVSEEWQQNLFSSLASRPNSSTISVFAYAIWRERHFVERFSISQLLETLNALSKRLARINTVKANGDGNSDNRIDKYWIRATAETLELLLGLLRTRASTDPEIRMLLQPHQRITKKLADQVERVTEVVAQSKVFLFSRVQLNIQIPDTERTPDLLYALRLYLTGDDGANAIHITSVSDNDDD